MGLIWLTGLALQHSLGPWTSPTPFIWPTGPNQFDSPILNHSCDSLVNYTLVRPPEPKGNPVLFSVALCQGTGS